MTNTSYTPTHRNVVLLAVLTALYGTGAFAAPAGKVEFVTGNVVAVASDGKSRPLSKGAEINAGDTIQTGTGRAQLRFSDGGFMSLSPNTEFGVNEYHYEGKTDGNEKSLFKLVKGGLRAITGAIGHVNKKNYKIDTPTATIGIRGTEFLTTMHGNKLLVRVGDGAVYIVNEFGELVLYKGQSGEVDGGAPTYTTDEPMVTAAGPDGVNFEDTQGNPSQYVAGQDTNNAGESCLLASCSTTALPTGSFNSVAFAEAWVDNSDGWLSDNAIFFSDSSSTYNVLADVNGVKKITEIDMYGNVNTLEANTDVVRDNYGKNLGLSWSRWTGGSYTEAYNGVPTNTEQQSVNHFIWGSSTPTADLDSLYSTPNAIGGYGFVATYSVVGYTPPTLTDMTTGAFSNVAGAVTGTLVADFGSGDVDLNLTVGSAGNFNATGSNYASSGLPKFLLSDGGGFTASGFFSGPKAAQAAMSYQYNDSVANTVLSGTAAFNQTSLTPSTYGP